MRGVQLLCTHKEEARPLRLSQSQQRRLTAVSVTLRTVQLTLNLGFFSLPFLCHFGDGCQRLHFGAPTCVTQLGVMWHIRHVGLRENAAVLTVFANTSVFKHLHKFATGDTKFSKFAENKFSGFFSGERDVVPRHPKQGGSAAGKLPPWSVKCPVARVRIGRWTL